MNEPMHEMKNEEVKIHFEVGTGMGRTGVNPHKVEEYITKIRKYKNIKKSG